MEEKGLVVTELMNDKGVWRTAPATPGRLNINPMFDFEIMSFRVEIGKGLDLTMGLS